MPKDGHKLQISTYFEVFFGDYLQKIFDYTLCCNSVKEQLTMLKMYMQGRFRRLQRHFHLKYIN